MRTASLVVIAVLIIAIPASAKCPAGPGTTVVVRAPAGNLIVDTTGSGSIEVEVRGIELRETCGRDVVELSTATSDPGRSDAEWRIRTPRQVNLDLVTHAGSIRVGDTEGSVRLRTTGGSVVVGQVGGSASIVTQGGLIKVGNIGNAAELRSDGGSLEVGNVGGNAEFQTGTGPISAGLIGGRVRAETAGGSITIREVRGDVVASTLAGSITLGDTGRATVKTAGGDIVSRKVRGGFKGTTEGGDIRIEHATGWIEAMTGFGNIFVRLIPDSMEADLHVDLQTGVGDVVVHLPEKFKANIDATVEKASSRQSSQIHSDFSAASTAPDTRSLLTSRFFAGLRSSTVINGGGNRVRLHTSLGKIEIKKN